MSRRNVRRALLALTAGLLAGLLAHHSSSPPFWDAPGQLMQSALVAGIITFIASVLLPSD